MTRATTGARRVRMIDRGGEKSCYLTAEQFMKFLNHEQRDPRLNEILYPYCDVKKAQQLIDQFEARSGSSPTGGQ